MTSSPAGAIPMKSEASLEAASANAAAYGWYFRLIDGLVSANRKAGLDETAAKRIAVSTLIAAGRVALEAQRDGEEILESLATPGGITTQGLAILEENDAFDPWSQAFEAVSDRLMSG